MSLRSRQRPFNSSAMAWPWRLLEREKKKEKEGRTPVSVAATGPREMEGRKGLAFTSELGPSLPPPHRHYLSSARASALSVSRSWLRILASVELVLCRCCRLTNQSAVSTPVALLQLLPPPPALHVLPLIRPRRLLSSRLSQIQAPFRPTPLQFAKLKTQACVHHPACLRTRVSHDSY